MVGVAGCTISDPTIKGGPAAGTAPAATAAPTRDPAWEPTIAALSALAQHAAACVGAASALSAPPQFAARYTSCRDAFSAHLARCGRIDPLDETSDAVAGEPSPTPAPAPVSVAAADARFTALLGDVTKHSLELFSAFARRATPDAQPLGLTALSLHLAAHAARTPSVRFAPGAGAPTRFSPTTPGASRGVILTQVWAAIYAYEVGLGIMSAREPLAKQGLSRLAELKQVRDDMTATIAPANRPEQLPAYDLGGTPDSLAAIQKIWSLAELRLMNAWARLAAASPQDAEARATAVAQVRRVVTLGGAMPFWPGWV